MVLDEPVASVDTVERLRQRHQELKAEMDTREESFGSVVEAGREMIDQVRLDKIAWRDKWNCVMMSRTLLQVTAFEIWMLIGTNVLVSSTS